MSTTLMDPVVGTLLDQRYRVVRKIAQGGMASVYEARDERLERAVAVKIMHAPYADDQFFVEEFIREAKTAAAFNNPHVVAVYDQGIENNVTFLVMELVNGHTLRDLLRSRGRLSPSEAVNVLEPVLEALAAAHQKKLVHRDVKPENVLISAEGKIKVADFGLARAVEASPKLNTTKGLMMGTVAYVAPEQISDGEASTRSDVYAVGIMLFEMLTGAPPFTGTSAVNIAFQHVHNDVPAPSTVVNNLPSSLDSLVVSATRRDKTARPPDATELLVLLRRARAELARPAGKPAHHALTATKTMLLTDPNRTSILPAEHKRLPAFLTSIRKLPRKPLIIAGVVILAIIAAILGWWLVSPDTTITPSVVNLTEQQAKEKASKVGVSIKVSAQEFSERIPKGHIIRQNPAAEEKIEEGNAIKVAVSKGPERHVVPALSGMTEDKAEQALKKLQFTAKTIREYNDSVAKDTVIRSEPGQGTQLRPGESVTIVVSKGVQPIDMPDVVGLTRQEAESQLSSLGLTVDVKLDSSGSAPAGEVIAQDPSAGSQLSKGDTVTLTVSDAIVVPNVVGMHWKEAESTLRDLGLKVDRKGDHGGMVFAQNPPPGSQASAGDEVTLWVF